MAKITTYTDLNDGTEFTIDLSASTLALAVAGNLSNDGVTGQSVFSACEDLWKTGATHNRYRFPFGQAVGELAESIELWGGWANLNATTLNLIRDSGVRFRSGYGAAATVTDEWCCIVQSGTFGLASTQPYVLLDTDTAPTNLNYTGEFNELVKIFNSSGDDDRGSLKIYAREEGYTYSYYDLNTSQEVTTLLPVSYLIPMNTEVDGNWGTTDANVAADAPYTGIVVYTTLDGSGFEAWANSTVYAANAVVSDGGRWYITALGGTSSGTGVGDDTGVTDWTAFSGEREIDGTYYAFNILIDGNNATKQQIWEKHQYNLRQTSDIDQHASISQRGDTATDKLSWEGTTLVTAQGVYVDNFQAAEGSEYIFTDVNGGRQSIPPTVIFSAPNIIDDSRIRLYNVTQASEIENTVISGGSGYSRTLTTSDYNSGDTLTFLATYQVGGVAKQVFRASTVVTSANVTATDSQVDWDDPGPNTLGIDGSTVTECVTDYSNIEVEISDPDDTTQKQRIAAFIVDAITTADGIRNWVSLDGNAVIRYSTNTAAQIDVSVAALNVVNTKASGELIIQDTFEFDWSDGTDRVSTENGPSTLWLAPARVLTIVSGSGVTEQDKTDIIDGVHSKETENGETFIETTRVIRSATAGKSSVSGTNYTFRDAADTKDRITSTVDSNGQRTSVTTDGT